MPSEISAERLAELERKAAAYGESASMRDEPASATWGDLRGLCVERRQAAERADRLERELRGKDSALATAEALVLSHEGRIAALEQRAGRLAGLLREWFRPQCGCWSEWVAQEPGERPPTAPVDGCNCWPCRVARELEGKR